MFCNRCGNSIPDNAQFCNACGQPVMTDITVPASVVPTVQNPNPTTPPSEREKHYWWLAIVAAIAVIASVACFLIFSGSSDTEKTKKKKGSVISDTPTTSDISNTSGTSINSGFSGTHTTQTGSVHGGQTVSNAQALQAMLDNYSAALQGNTEAIQTALPPQAWVALSVDFTDSDYITILHQGFLEGFQPLYDQIIAYRLEYVSDTALSEADAAEITNRLVQHYHLTPEDIRMVHYKSYILDNGSASANEISYEAVKLNGVWYLYTAGEFFLEDFIESILNNVEEPEDPQDLHTSRMLGLQTMFDNFTRFLLGDISYLDRVIPTQSLAKLSVNVSTLKSDPRYAAALLESYRQSNSDMNPIIYGENPTAEYILEAYGEVTGEYRTNIESSLAQNYGLVAEDICVVRYQYVRRGEKGTLYDEGQTYAVKISGTWYLYANQGFVPELHMQQLISAVG